MTSPRGHAAFVVAACVALGACQLRRPDVVPTRMIEPLLVEPARQAGDAATPVRLLETLAREHIGRHLLLRQANGELVEDSVWRWTSAPARYLDLALRLELTSSGEVRMVDSGRARTLAVTLTEWHVDAGGKRIVAAATLELMAPDRHVGTVMIRDEEPMSSELPGDLAAASGRLLQRLSKQIVARAAAATGE
jgi:hypothetical protein